MQKQQRLPPSGSKVRQKRRLAEPQARIVSFTVLQVFKLQRKHTLNSNDMCLKRISSASGGGFRVIVQVKLILQPGANASSGSSAQKPKQPPGMQPTSRNSQTKAGEARLQLHRTNSQTSGESASNISKPRR